MALRWYPQAAGGVAAMLQSVVDQFREVRRRVDGTSVVGLGRDVEFLGGCGVVGNVVGCQKGRDTIPRAPGAEISASHWIPEREYSRQQKHFRGKQLISAPGREEPLFPKKARISAQRIF